MTKSSVTWRKNKKIGYSSLETDKNNFTQQLRVAAPNRKLISLCDSLLVRSQGWHHQPFLMMVAKFFLSGSFWIRTKNIGSSLYVCTSRAVLKNPLYLLATKRSQMQFHRWLEHHGCLMPVGILMRAPLCAMDTMALMLILSKNMAFFGISAPVSQYHTNNHSHTAEGNKSPLIK